MEMNKRRPVESFLPVRKVRLSQDAKMELAFGAYLVLEAINETAPRGCDGMPMELMVDASVNGAGARNERRGTRVMSRRVVREVEAVRGTAECESRFLPCTAAAHGRFHGVALVAHCHPF